MSKPADQPDDDFLSSAQHQKERGLIGEFFGFLKENKLWWLTPILLVLLLVGVLLVLGGTGVLPFIYIVY